MADPEQLPDATETAAVDPSPTITTTQPGSTASKQSKQEMKKKQAGKRDPKEPHVRSQFTIRNPSWTYVRLQHLPSSSSSSSSSSSYAAATPPSPPLDAVTAHLHLTAALSQFLGLHGAAMQFDILRLDAQDVWVRVPGEDRSALVAAVGGWVGQGGQGWRVKGWSSWDVDVAGGGDGGQGLFTD